MQIIEDSTERERTLEKHKSEERENDPRSCNEMYRACLDGWGIVKRDNGLGFGERG